MSCAKFETDIALYAGDDLPAGKRSRIEAHLAACADCRALAEDLRTNQALLGDLRDEPIEESMVAQVRRRVMAKVSPAPRRPARLYWKLALAAALILVAVLVWPRRQVKPVRVAHVERHIAPPQIAPAAQVSIRPVRHRIIRRRPRTPASPPGPPLLVQFVTENPNIVIYWLVDQKQGD